MKVGVRISNTKNVLNAQIKDLSSTSEANQFKVAKTIKITFTAITQTVVSQHGAGYTPAFLGFQKQSNHTYYSWLSSNDYIDSSNLSLSSFSGLIADTKSCILFKDFGA